MSAPRWKRCGSRALAPKPQTELWERPGYLIRRLHQIHVALFLEECRAFDITPVQYALMTTLLNRPGCDQISLAHDSAIDRSSVADVLMRLEERGLIRRGPSATDRRVKLAYLTAPGEALTRDMEGAMLAAQERFVAPLPADERSEFLRMMGILVEANNAYSRAPLAGRGKT